MNIRDRYATTACSNCGEQTPCDNGAQTASGENLILPHNGFCLNLTGHYGGFTDDVEGKLAFVVLCHDCSLRIARALPGVFNGGGCHSMFSDETEKSCCEFAWTFDKDEEQSVLHGDGFGGWFRPNQN